MDLRPSREMLSRFSMHTLTLNNLVFEPLREADFPLLHTWLNTPHVAERWDGTKSVDGVSTKYADKLKSDWQEAYIVSTKGERFGYIQSYVASKAGEGWWSGELDSTRGIDQFIGETSCLGRGLGTKMACEFSDWLLTLPNVTKVITDPDPSNERAIRCYRKAGFREVGLVNTPDGKILLMEKRRDNSARDGSADQVDR